MSSHANRVPGQPPFLNDLNSKIDPDKESVLNPAALLYEPDSPNKAQASARIPKKEVFARRAA
jgi:hypothetical protein